MIVGQNVPVAKLEQSARDAVGATLRNVVVFDVYMGENIDIGSKSVGLGLILQETSRTLKDADVDSIVRAVMGRLARDFNASIRE